MAPTIAGSSSTTRIRRGRVLIVIMVLALAVQTATAAGSATTNRAPCGRAGSHHRRAPIDSPRRLAAYRPIPEPRAVWVSRRAYGSKIRSRHSSGMPGPSSRDAELDDALVERPVDPDGRLGRRVLDRVLDEVLEDLAQPRRVGQGVEPDARHDLDRVVLEDRPERGRRPRRRAPPRSTGVTDRRALRHDPDGRQDRVDQAVEPLDLLERRPMPRRRASRGGRCRATRGRAAAARRPAGRRRRGRSRAASAARG